MKTSCLQRLPIVNGARRIEFWLSLYFQVGRRWSDFLERDKGETGWSFFFKRAMNELIWLINEWRAEGSLCIFMSYITPFFSTLKLLPKAESGIEKPGSRKGLGDIAPSVEFAEGCCSPWSSLLCWTAKGGGKGKRMKGNTLKAEKSKESSS